MDQRIEDVLQYEASDLERTWKSKSGDKEWIDHPCDHLQDKAQEWMELLGDRSRLSPSEADESIFSAFKNADISHPIEPLAYILRAPTFKCSPGTNDVFNKDFLVLATDEMFPNRANSYLFDAGCTMYQGSAQGVMAGETHWFVDRYKRNGIDFDHIYGWEAKPIDPKVFWDHVPDEVMAKMTFYNVAAPKAADEMLNPVTLLKARCKVEDFCVLKIDVDTSDVEMAWMEQILNDDVAQSLIDELFFEHHVHGLMQKHGWGSNVEGTFEDSYELFTRLREAGIRAHSWV